MKRRRRRWRLCSRFRGSIPPSLWLASKAPNLKWVRPLFCVAILLDPSRISWSDCSPAADEVHDDRDQGEDEQQVNEEAAHVQDEEAAEPEQNQHNSQNEEHEMTYF